MDGTPKLKRKSLTLGRAHRADVPTTPQQRAANVDSDYMARSTPTKATKSPSVASLSSDGGIECTPPQKKRNLDDSIDYSPKCFDTSFSPSCLLSQSLASDSPEVGWKWNRRNTDELAAETATTTPDSAYAADSSFTSAGSTSTEVTRAAGRLRSNSQCQRIAYELQREEQRKKREVQLRRAAKMRTDELLKQRYAKLQEQLRDADARKQKEKEKENQPFSLPLLAALHSAESEVVRETNEPEMCAVVTTKSATDYANDTLDDFLNDSDSDCLLLEATQQVESKIVKLTQVPETEELAQMSDDDEAFKSTQMPDDDDEAFKSTQMPDDEAFKSTQMPDDDDEAFKLTQMPDDDDEAFKLTQMPADEEFKLTQIPQTQPTDIAAATSSVTASSTTARQDKRSSLYMKFLEEDSPDDWFLSLDDVILEATQQNKKSRSNFQRYNSMPTNTLTTLAASSANVVKTTSTTTTTAARSVIGCSDNAATTKMKRHSSSHTISAASAALSSDQRGRQLHLRK